jgi:hypothetical protein
MSTPSQPSEAPDLAAVERDLRGWSWATGGWAAFHALGGLFVVASGGLSGVPSGALRLVILVLVGAWATTAIASWQFRRSFRAKVGMIAAVASILAGITMLASAVGFASLEASVDGIGHLVAGIGLARAIRQARPLLLFA